jgi:hypothetical protein
MRRLFCVPVAVIVLVLAAPAVSVAAGPALPSADPFYSYSGSLSAISPGTVLKSRSVPLDEMGLTAPVKAMQVLYRTTGELGQPTVTVATIVAPLVSPGATKLVSYQMAYDGMAAQCDPSYAIQGGTPTESTNSAELQLILGLVATGDTVVTADYEGEQLDFGAGQESGAGTLDAIRATEASLKLPTATPVALVGYSGGSIATDFAAELAPSYAPQLNIVGAAMGGIPVDYAHNLAYINGSATWGGAIPAVLVGLARAFNINLNDYLSAYGQNVVNSVKDECLASSLGQYPNLTYQKMFKPQYQDAFNIPVFVNVFNRLIMGDSGTPREPLFMGVGNADGTGDDVMVAADDQALAHTYCERGLSVQFNEYKGDDHESAALAFLPAALPFIAERLNGVAVTNGCASIGAGNSLAPLPVPKTSWKLTASPAHPRAGVRTRFRFALKMTAGAVTTPYRGATIRFANHHAKTTRTGRATLALALHAKPGAVYRARASVAGHRVATVKVTIRRS